MNAETVVSRAAPAGAAQAPASGRPAVTSWSTVPGLENAVAAVTVDGEGRIVDCDQTVERLFGYRRQELLARHISMLVPRLQDSNLLEETGRLNFMAHAGCRFVVRARGDVAFASELYLVDLQNPGPRTLRLIIRPMEERRPIAA